jgi:hypothetical protein
MCQVGHALASLALAQQYFQISGIMQYPASDVRINGPGREGICLGPARGAEAEARLWSSVVPDLVFFNLICDIGRSKVLNHVMHSRHLPTILSPLRAPRRSNI